jgi:hypothetical protein
MQGTKTSKRGKAKAREGLQAETTCVESMRIYTFRLPETGKSLYLGEMVEWFKAPVLKTGEAQASGGSNPSLSATSLFSLEKINFTKEITTVR